MNENAKQDAKRSLVVLVHGWTLSKDDMRPLATFLRSGTGPSPGSDVLLCGYDSRVMSNLDPEVAALEMKNQIENRWEESGPYENVILCGHSFGGLVLRKAYLLGLHAGAATSPWVSSVKRIVLLAAPNRGTQYVAHYLSAWLFDRVASALGVAQFIQSSYQGTPFIVNLRLDWLETVNPTALKGRGITTPPVIVQMLGTRDDVVIKQDSIDLEAIPEFIAVDVSGSTHGGIIDLNNKVVANSVRKAFMQTRATKSTLSDKGAHHVFLMHGIRDYGEWLTKLEEAMRASEPNIHVHKDSHGYFTVSGFLNPVERNRRVKWFADLYTQIKAEDPGARISYVGHSFGTYILGDALKNYDRIHVDRVYFAGSVLPRNFNWHPHFVKEQIQYLRNDCATADIWVGVFSKALGLVYDLGDAGCNGFEQQEAERLYENKYFRGDHGAALCSSNLKSIANSNSRPAIFALKTRLF